MSDSVQEQVTGFESLSDEDVVLRLAALGANTCNQSYDQKQKNLSDRFVKLNLKMLANMWDYLDDRVKIRVVNSNSDKFKEWISSFSEDV